MGKPFDSAASLASAAGTTLWRRALAALDAVDSVLPHPVFGPLRGQRVEAGGPGERALYAVLLNRTCRLRIVQASDRHADGAAGQTVIREGSAAGAAKAPLHDVRARKHRRAPPG